MKKSEILKISKCCKCGNNAEIISRYGNYRAKYKVTCSVCDNEQEDYQYGGVIAVRKWNFEQDVI